jgi:hypothetical protein
MSTTLPNPPRVAFVDPATGLLTRDGDAYIRGLFKRVGETTALTNTELAALLNGVQSGEMVFQPGVSNPTFPDVTQPATADPSFADVMQTFDATTFDEITFQH